MSKSATAKGARRQRLRSAAAILIPALVLGACISPTARRDGRYTTPMGNAPVVSNETPYSAGLRCLASYALQGQPMRIAVGQIADYTGKDDIETGREVTQGAALMAMSALSKTGVRLVERFDTSVAELELKYASNQLIGEGVDDATLRGIIAGQFRGSDYYLVGGITELNANLRTVNGDAKASGPTSTSREGTLGYKAYVMNVALDLRLVSTKTLEVVDVISYQKQIIGRQISAGVFDFLNGTIIDVGVGEQGQEPLQLAVRSVVERAVLEIMSRQLGVDAKACGGRDPLAGADDARRPPAVKKVVAERRRQEAQRGEPYRGYTEVEKPAEFGLRRGVN